MVTVTAVPLVCPIRSRIRNRSNTKYLSLELQVSDRSWEDEREGTTSFVSWLKDINDEEKDVSSLSQTNAKTCTVVEHDEGLVESCGESETEVSIKCNNKKRSWVEVDEEQEASNSCSVFDQRPQAVPVEKSVGLKLDNYQEILDVWCDRAPFCDGEDGKPDWCPAEFTMLSATDTEAVEWKIWTFPDLNHRDRTEEQRRRRKERKHRVLPFMEKTKRISYCSLHQI